MTMRRCASARCPVLVADGQRYCTRHQADYETRRGTSTQRGYNARHQALRTQWAARIQAGEHPACSRCGKPIEPFEPFDLDHDDTNRDRWLGPAHQHCNRSAGGRNGAAASNHNR